MQKILIVPLSWIYLSEGNEEFGLHAQQGLDDLQK